MNKEHNHHLHTLHPMSSFGIVSGLTNQIRVTRLEKRLNPAVPFPHKHNFYHVVIITEGKGWHEIDFKKHNAGPGSFFFMKPAQVHSWSLKKETKGIVIEFEHLSMFASEGLNPEELQDYFNPSAAIKKEVIGIAKKMLEEYEGEKKDFDVVLRFYLAALTVVFSRIKSPEKVKVNRVSRFREDFFELIENNYKKHHEVSFYSKTLKITTKALTAKVNRTIGKNVRDIIQERCILESKRMLAYSDLSVSEIALQLGFDDPNYFTRFFKLKTKMNPGKFRQKVRTHC